ncbi:MAG TPA: type II toxin-antitoxin system HicB family antitoxin [Chloroflexota bacterium]|nr:type II toxin-antitoxin system HicB family antitoxin [Chloroflexota bacterium]
MRRYRFSVVVERDSDGFFAYCPQLQGCYADGETEDEVLANIEDAIRLHVEDRLATGEEIPQAEHFTGTNVEVAVE